MPPLPSDIHFREATKKDLNTIVSLLINDPLGQGRENATDLSPYQAAFDAIEQDKNQFLIVGEHQGIVMATLQLSFIPGLSRGGAWRAQIEAVRVADSYRGQGVGKQLFQWAINLSKEKNCRLIQLTTDKTRQDAHRFYDDLGFIASHEGYKLAL